MIAEGYGRECVWSMPLGMLWSEAILTRRRVRENAAMQAVLIHAAIVDAIGGGGHLRTVIEGLVDE